MKYQKRKYVPTLYGFDSDKNFYCDYEEAIWNKYGLNYTMANDFVDVEQVYLKGKKYNKPPYCFNSYKEMLKKMERYARAIQTVEDKGNIRENAVYLILEINEDGMLLSDLHSINGYVAKKGTIFFIQDEFYRGDKTKIELSDQNKQFVFPDFGKTALYLEKTYGHWACSHYLKNLPRSL